MHPLNVLAEWRRDGIEPGDARTCRILIEAVVRELRDLFRIRRECRAKGAATLTIWDEHLREVLPPIVTALPYLRRRRDFLLREHLARSPDKSPGSEI